MSELPVRGSTGSTKKLDPYLHPIWVMLYFLLRLSLELEVSPGH